MENLSKHMKETGTIVKKFGIFLGLEKNDLKNLYIAGTLHDVGKYMINQQILNKDSKLTNDEFEEIKKHPIYSKEMLNKGKYNNSIILGVAQHHERIDGYGYPEGISGDEISLIGKILAICDSYEAMIGLRKYREPKSKEEAIKEIKSNLNTQFDKKIGLQFIKFAKENL